MCLSGSRHQRNLPPGLPRYQGALHAQQQGRLRQDQPVQRHCHLDGRAGAAHPCHRRRRAAQPVQQLRHAPQREELRRGGTGGAGFEQLHPAHQI